MLINEQISDAAERHEKELIQELEQQVRELASSLQVKE